MQAISANLLAPPDGKVTDIAGLLATLKEWADANAEIVQSAKIILGFGYDQSQLTELRAPTKEELDTVSADVPVVIVHQSAHMGALNTKALALAGYTADTPNPPGGVIDRKSGSQEPSGVIEEAAWFNALPRILGNVGPAGIKMLAQAGAEMWASFGYTTAQEGRSSQTIDAVLKAVTPARHGRRLALLGRMKDLGALSNEFHAGLAPHIWEAGVTAAVLVGAEMKPLAAALGRSIDVRHVADADAARLTMLTARLLELARADLGANDPAARADLADVLRRHADACGAGFAVAADLAPRMPLLAMPEAALDAVVGALIDNARQAGAQRIAFTARIVAGTGMAHITIADDGPGIAPSDRARVFEPFFTTRRASGGSGLGLPIVLSLVDAAGGELQLDESEADGEGGARFVLTVPVAADRFGPANV
jgi:hypothetical protein